MHQRELTKHIGPLATSFSWRGYRAVLCRNPGRPSFSLKEIKGPPGSGDLRVESYSSPPGFAAHGRAVKILTEWWGK